MKLSKIGRDEYQLQIDGIVHDLDLTGIDACCPDTKAIYAGLKYIADDPQYYSFFVNCFGNPHSLTYFPENLTDNLYDADKQKQKIYNQARLLHGKIREYFLEAILKHCLWINNADYWTNCKFEFEKVLMPELRIMLMEWDKRAGISLEVSTEEKIDNDEKEENDLIQSTIDDYLFEFKEERILIDKDYDLLVFALCNYFKNGVFPENSKTIKVSRVNKKRFGWALNEIFKSIKSNNEALPVEYLQFSKRNISIFKDVDFNEADVLRSNLYKYFTTRIS